MRGKKINSFSRAYSLFLKCFNSAAPALSTYAGPNFSAQYNQQTLAGHQTSMHHLCCPRTGISSFPSVVCQTLSLVRSLWLDLSEGTEGFSRWRGRTVAVGSTCMEEHPVASLKFKTQKNLGVFVLQRCGLRGCSCWLCCLPFTCLAPSWDHLPADSCPFTRIAAL